jgi:hypothetical protein
MFNQVLMHTCLNKVIFAKTCINVHKWKKNHQILQEKSKYLWNNFPRAMEGLENKRKMLNIDDGEGHLVDQSLFTSFYLPKTMK